MSDDGWILLVPTNSYDWNSRDGFRLTRCAHGRCLRCRVRWLIHLWRIGNRVFYLP